MTSPHAPRQVLFDPPPRARPPLGPLEVHVWSVDLSVPAEGGDGVWQPELSPGERERAARFYAAQHGRRFAVAHGALRHILGSYLERQPADVHFGVGEHGKPHLLDGTSRGSGSMQFNISHSGDRALIAVASVGPVGIDVENHRSLTDRDALARRHFSPAEIMVLEDLPEAARTAGFFRCWSRKEAFIKCIGRGLTQALDSFDVSLEPMTARLLAIRDPDLESAHFEMWDLDVGTDAAAALAVRGRAAGVRAWHWAPPV